MPSKRRSLEEIKKEIKSLEKEEREERERKKLEKKLAGLKASKSTGPRRKITKAKGKGRKGVPGAIDRASRSFWG